MMNFAAVLGLLFLSCTCDANTQERKFPKDFIFGAASAAYQIEGGWNADGKGESIWDRKFHTLPVDGANLRNQRNGDVAADTYHNYKRDVEMMREIGLEAYRFSISWSRILPNGRSNYINAAGVNFYNNYINEMVKYNITPMVTLYHWDLPQKLQDLGGFVNPLISDWFEEYARVVFEVFGDRVKHWITFTEPVEICFEGYGLTFKAPGVNASGIGEYLCAMNLVISHAKAYHAYVKDFKEKQGGVCGIAISLKWLEGATDSNDDQLVAELQRQAGWGLFVQPIFSHDGGFPKLLTNNVAEKSKQQGYSSSRMPTLTEDEKGLIKGSYDFFGVNHYSAGEYKVSAKERRKTVYDVPSLADDIVNPAREGMVDGLDLTWREAYSDLVKLPNSICKVLTYIQYAYNITPIFYITRNGWPTNNGFVDGERIEYFRNEMESVLDCLEAMVDVRGYMYWSLMDGFGWREGYIERFGLYEVDFESPARPRTPRKSAFVYKHVIKNRIIDHSYDPGVCLQTHQEQNYEPFL